MAIRHGVPKFFQQLIFFSGLAADSDVFASLKIAFPQLIVPPWPIPHPNDTLDTYCDRLAKNLRFEGDCVIGGASFGGIIAQHVAEPLKPRAVVLIGSIRSPSEIPRLVRLCRPLKPLIPLIPVRFLQFCCSPIASGIAHRFFPHLSGLARQFCVADGKVFKWSLARILDWQDVPALECPVFQIHGRRDFVLPARYTRPDAAIENGGHVISMTHPKEVNDFISSVLSRIGNSE